MTEYTTETAMVVDPEWWRTAKPLCMYCGVPVSDDIVPPVDDGDAWGEVQKAHAIDCEWANSRAHRWPYCCRCGRVEIAAPDPGADGRHICARCLAEAD